MVSTRRSALQAPDSKATVSIDEDGSASSCSAVSTASSRIGTESSLSAVPSPLLRGGEGNVRSSGRDESPGVLTRKRRLLQEIEAHLAVGVTPYWEGSIETRGDSDAEESWETSGIPRRSRRGEARRRYEDVAGLLREHQKMAVNLPPMVSTREGKLLAVEVFGNGVLEHLRTQDKGPRVGHCSSGYVCGYPVPRGKEGNLWCQTPVRASLESKMACTHHSHRRGGPGGPSEDQLRYMILAGEFYDQNGDISWLRVVSHLRSQGSPLERRQRRQVLAFGGRALMVSDAKIVLHGFAQCTLFWLAACRLTRRGYRFSMVAHESKTEFREFLTDLRASAVPPPPKQASSPFVYVTDMFSSNACYYASGYDQLCRLF